MYYLVVFMAPIPPSRHYKYQFRAEELNNFLDIVKISPPILVQNWQAVADVLADVHLENYCQEAQMAKSMRHNFQEMIRRTSPRGENNCPNYVIKAKCINRQLVQMVDASSGGSKAKRSEDGLSDDSDISDDAGVALAGNVAVLDVVRSWF